MSTFKDSGQRSQFETGAQRDTQGGKGRFDLVSTFGWLFVARIFETGCLKYGDRNWEKGIPISRYVDSALRHLNKYLAGMRDEPHLSMAAWNCLCALWTNAQITMGLRSASLYDLPNHIANEPATPLAPFELEALESFIGRKLEK